ncbi:MAG: TonB C-terminal domain-containing protein [Lentisphaeraceae bacterium]|nr:TonB C-terminal domain-containing protein [Lentisphaeraceae bacterium]
MKSKRPQLPLFIIAFMGHILSLFILWVFISQEDVQQPVFEKVISVKITKNAPSHLPPINQTERNKIAEEKRQKEAAEKKRIEDKKRAEQKKRDDAKKKLDAKKESDNRKEKAAETAKKKESDTRKKKAAEAAKKAAKQKAAREKASREKAAKKSAQAKAAREKASREKAAKQKADAARRATQAKAAQRRQTSLGQHVNAAISERVEQEWNRLTFAATQFSNTNDVVKIQITISKTGKVISARITKRASSQALNSNAQALFKRITASTYRFPPFHRDYNKSTMTVEYQLKASN